MLLGGSGTVTIDGDSLLLASIGADSIDGDVVAITFEINPAPISDFQATMSVALM